MFKFRYQLRFRDDIRDILYPYRQSVAYNFKLF